MSSDVSSIYSQDNLNSPNLSSNGIYEFEDFRLDAAHLMLYKNQQPIPLAPKVIETLVALVERRGEVISKDELMNRLWADTVVEESNLTQNIYLLRKTLGKDSDGRDLIETFRRRGYRFTGNVKVRAAPPVMLDDKQATAGEAMPMPDLRLDGNTVADVPEGLPTDADEHRGSFSDSKGIEGKGNAVGFGRSEPGDASVAATPLSNEDSSSAATRRNLLPEQRPRRRLALAALTSVAGISLFVYLFSVNRSNSSTPIQSIAVLPFKALNAEVDDESLGLGMADTLITKFSSTGRFIVPSTSVIKKYGNTEDPIAAGRELGVDAVLEGNIQRAGNQVRINARLLSVKSSLPLWTDKFDGDFKDIFMVQDRFSQQVAQSLTMRLTGEERQRLVKHPTNDTEAYQAYLQGRYFWNKRTEEGYKKAIEFFEQALQRDPNFALAYSGLADCYLLRSEQLAPAETMPKSKTAAEQAIALDDTLAEAYTSLARVKQYFDWDWAGAEEVFKKALERNPNYATAHHWYGQFLQDMGKATEARQELSRARALEPLSLVINTDWGSFLRDAGDCDEAITVYRKVIAMDNSFGRAHLELGRALTQKSLYPEAIAEIQKAIDLSEASPRMLAALGYVCAISGRRDKAQEISKRLQQMAKEVYVSPYSEALLYAGLGEKERAFELLEKAYQDRLGLMVYLKIDPRFENLRADQRFTDLLRRIRLVES